MWTDVQYIKLFVQGKRTGVRTRGQTKNELEMRNAEDRPRFAPQLEGDSQLDWTWEEELAQFRRVLEWNDPDWDNSQVARIAYVQSVFALADLRFSPRSILYARYPERIDVERALKLLFNPSDPSFAMINSQAGVSGEPREGALRWIDRQIGRTLKDKDKQMIFCDLGAGRGNIGWYLSLVRMGHTYFAGLEVSPDSVSLALDLHQRLLALMPRIFVPPVPVLLADITKVPTYEPFTHLYVFDKGMPPALRDAIEEKVAASETCIAFISHHEYDIPWARYAIKRTGFSMRGSSEGFTLRVYLRRAPLPDPEEDRLTEHVALK